MAVRSTAGSQNASLACDGREQGRLIMAGDVFPVWSASKIAQTHVLRGCARSLDRPGLCSCCHTTL